MFVRAMFISVAIAVLGLTVVHATAVLARARVHRAAALAADSAFDAAIATTQESLSAALASGTHARATFGPPPNTQSCAATASDGSCALSTQTTFASTTTQRVSTSQTCAPICAENVQGNDNVREGRVAMHVTVVATNATGETLALRDRYAIFRTLDQPPSAQLVGTRDATDAAIAQNTAEGDDAGTPALSTIEVRYVNAATGASMSANAWQARGWNTADANSSAWQP